MPLSQSENLTTCIGVGGRGCPFKQLVSNLVRETGTTLLETRWGDITSSVLESLILRVVTLPFALPRYFSNFFSGFALFQFNPFAITCILFSYSGGWHHLQLFFMIQLCVEWCKEWWRSYTCRFVNLPLPHDLALCRMVQRMMKKLYMQVCKPSPPHDLALCRIVQRMMKKLYMQVCKPSPSPPPHDLALCRMVQRMTKKLYMKVCKPSPYPPPPPLS